jgi:hypothetical protein
LLVTLSAQVLGIRAGDCVVFSAAMPEASIHEDSYSLPWKHDISGTP